ncbi:MAG: hypothetical protein D6814_17640 [Calditrichaeota bacterium]|nr:MAG: hypothetical protein D6814_17640 [Calditrichota bacterium]
MSPFHPKLRRALLRDPLHRKNGLNAQLLLEYEKLETQLYYLVHYPAQGNPPKGPGGPDQGPPNPVTPESLLEEIKSFRARYMPNFESIHKNWLEGQKRALLRHEFDFAPTGKNLKQLFSYLGRWLIVVFSKNKNPHDPIG